MSSAMRRSSAVESAAPLSAARSALRVTAVRLCPISSCSSLATRSRSRSWAARATRALSRRSASSRSSIPLKAVASLAASGCRGPTSSILRPGRSGSTSCMSSVTRRSGARIRRVRRRLTASMTTKPASRTSSCSSVATGAVISIGVTANNTTTSANTAPFATNRRQSSESPPLSEADCSPRVSGSAAGGSVSAGKRRSTATVIPIVRSLAERTRAPTSLP